MSLATVARDGVIWHGANSDRSLNTRCGPNTVIVLSAYPWEMRVSLVSTMEIDMNFKRVFFNEKFYSMLFFYDEKGAELYCFNYSSKLCLNFKVSG